MTEPIGGGGPEGCGKETCRGRRPYRCLCGAEEACPLCRISLRPFAFLYGLGAAIRAGLYRAGMFRTHRAARPVVSVGNLTSGGTGKTPMVEWLARRLAATGRKPAILSRGYRGKVQPDGTLANDEYLVLQANLPGVPHVQDPDRVRGAEAAIGKFGADVLVLDDGFQHLRLARDLDIALLDALDPWGGGACLPLGTAREFRGALSRAHAIVLTRADAVCPEARAGVRAEAERLAPGKIWAEAAFEPKDFVHAGGTTDPVDSAKGRPALAFCGIGNPESFRLALRAIGADVRSFRAFRDHHAYVERDLVSLAEEARSIGAARILCTQKDLVKIPADFAWPAPLAALRIEARFLSGEAALWEAAGKAAAPASA